MKDRREFLKLSAAALVAACARPPGVDVLPAPRTAPSGATFGGGGTDASVRDLANIGLQAARDAGASYADVRFGRYRRQSIGTRERQVTNVSDSESFGVGIRALVNGSWGFAATSDLGRESIARTAQEAARIARAARAAQRRPVELAPVQPVVASWRQPIEIDPLEVPIEEKVSLLFAANDAALRVPRIRYVSSGLQLLREEKTLATTDGTLVTQTFYRVGPSFNATAIGDGDFQSYSEELAPRGSGWEYVTGLDMPGNAERWASIAAEKLTARSVDVGRYDLILDPTNLWLTIHESIGHPTELDRAMGYEANFAGTSFLAPPDRVLNNFRYGPDWMQVKGDRTQPQSLARVAWDDEGVPAQEWDIVRNGMFVDYQTTREQVGWIADVTGRRQSHGCSFADSWSSVQFQRMPNVSLMPAERAVSLDDIIADTQRGIMFRNRGSWSIDHQRYNFQFSGQAVYEIRNGRITGMVRDAAYQANTPEFWNSMDMIGGPDTYWLGGSFGDGKGEPGQSNSVSHGCPPSRFRQVNIINTGRQG
ncbi:MAG TPA: TldD/PmbA family protein [Gemmatimonadaceae bacterium]|nr:TldD/PmbA family protein [Gemmatimonadaceae bacterium]